MLSRKAEDYLEAIFDIVEEKGYAKVKNIALTLGVKPPSVVDMLKRLNDMGLVEYRKYDGVSLTVGGEKIGRAVRFRHNTIKAFLEVIKVPEEIANKDACVIEHELDLVTVEQIKNLANFVKSAPSYPEWLEHFETFCKTGKHPCKESDQKAKKSSGF